MIADCVQKVDKAYLYSWNTTCLERGLLSDCRLPTSVAKYLDDRRHAEVDDCTYKTR